MRTGSSIKRTKCVAIRGIFFAPRNPIDSLSQKPFITPVTPEKTMTTGTGTTSDLNIFPSPFASREMRRSHLKAITGLFRSDISGKEVTITNKTRF